MPKISVSLGYSPDGMAHGKHQDGEAQMFTTECGKCGGKGNIPAFSNIDGGRCFSCAGKGQIVTKTAPKASIRFAISAVAKATGEAEVICFIKARTEAAAIKAAIAQLSKGNAYIPETAKVAAA
jgi:RecJ-like exonuclease